MSQFSFDQKNLLVGNQTWNDIVAGKGTFGLYTVLDAFKGIVARDGAVMISMPDEQGIKERMDRLEEVCDVAQRANEARQALGLETVDLQALGLQHPAVK